MIIELLKENWEILTGLIASIVAYFGGKKIKKAEENKANSDALTSMQSTYDTFVQDLKQRYDELKEEQRHFRSELIFYKEQIVELQKSNSELLKELKIWELKYIKLKSEFDNYKKNN